MTIWILAVVLLAAGAGLGFSQGAIRAAISFVGIVIAAVFAGILGNRLKPLFPHVGIHNPTVTWLVAPLLAFLLVLLVFKIAGFFVHRKIYLFYKYKAGDLRMALFKRLNSRIGACIGLLNGTVYLLLASIVIFDVGYWTVQIAPSSDESFVYRTINRLASDLEDTGLATFARSAAPLPAMYYHLADLAGLLRQNPQLKERLESYPTFLSLAERDDFKQLGQDSSFQQAWQNRGPISQILDDQQFKTMLKNSELTTMVVDNIESNWNDLTNYLRTGKSEKYESELVLGRWHFDVNVSVGMLLIAHPRITPAEIKGLRSLWSAAYAKTTFVASADHQAYLKGIPRFKMEKGAAVVAQKLNFQGKWSGHGTNYNLSLSGNGEQKSMTAHTDGLRMTITSGNDRWVFDHD